ncbi:hypothetical protein SAMN02799630_02327 [Paenibacillus sp. UNCCL117]|uniref:DUF6199 family natural product biosynthesis protein n=1 Tax=unclassified Paenibacillus TaxID=185978 RepID=UPI00088985B2|nr:MULTISPECIES: DUF6199 family natural product biosynthesis protein [unclassified Paenibacillus]SDD17729.1 hypothetical protein SAMN04488602_106203 [Paenibacillus sp. cl123]SFW35046.1 hypothetical protein SAMN02799630_02327 [Paenibacillus sp. UNCCL117]
MIGISVLLICFGLLMLIRPQAVWALNEKWKSSDATEPSDLYVWSTRFGGALCLLAGAGGLFALLLI